jgi:methylenetetrahydrofolate--tRNA-(uracil-5-)-methyltransferase
MLEFSENTIIGALIKYLTTAEAKGFQPMNANFGILPPLENPSRDKHQRKVQYTERAVAATKQMLSQNEI